MPNLNNNNNNNNFQIIPYSMSIFTYLTKYDIEYQNFVEKLFLKLNINEKDNRISFPYEIVLHFFEYLDLYSLLAVSQCSLLWLEFSNRELYWENLLKVDFQLSIKSFNFNNNNNNNKINDKKKELNNKIDILIERNVAKKLYINSFEVNIEMKRTVHNYLHIDMLSLRPINMNVII
jgi:hypothetical protein